MAYARWSIQSNVYVYDNVYGGTTCCGCLLAERPGVGDYHADTHAEMIAHLHEHVKQGHLVPQYTFEELSTTPDNDSEIEEL